MKLGVKDAVSDMHRITLDFFLKGADLTKVSVSMLYRILKLYHEEDIEYPEDVVETFLKFEEWLDSPMFMHEDVYSDIILENSTALDSSIGACESATPQQNQQFLSACRR